MSDQQRRVESVLRHGETGWGWYGSSRDHERYAVPIVSRRRCLDCPGKGMKRPRVTHAGKANGVALMSGCEWHVRQWVRDPVRK